METDESREHVYVWDASMGTVCTCGTRYPCPLAPADTPQLTRAAVPRGQQARLPARTHPSQGRVPGRNADMSARADGHR